MKNVIWQDGKEKYLHILDEDLNIIDSTMIYGLGFYDIKNNNEVWPFLIVI